MVRRGFAHQAVLILFLFASVPVMMWFYLSSKNANANPSVKGISSKESRDSSGFLISILSEGGSWDLYQYLCKTNDECTKNLEGGLRWETISGGVTSGHEIYTEEMPEWDSYRYIKLFAKPSWGSSYRKFTFQVVGEASSSMHWFKNGSEYIDTVLIPLEDIKEGLLREVRFADKSD
jgi:hypothetical protein